MTFFLLITAATRRLRPDNLPRVLDLHIDLQNAPAAKLRRVIYGRGAISRL